jgi:hypothetical protein
MDTVLFFLVLLMGISILTIIVSGAFMFYGGKKAHKPFKVYILSVVVWLICLVAFLILKPTP